MWLKPITALPACVSTESPLLYNKVFSFCGKKQQKYVRVLEMRCLPQRPSNPCVFHYANNVGASEKHRFQYKRKRIYASGFQAFPAARLLATCPCFLQNLGGTCWQRELQIWSSGSVLQEQHVSCAPRQLQRHPTSSLLILAVLISTKREAVLWLEAESQVPQVKTRWLGHLWKGCL